MDTKKCGKCQEHKSLHDFYQNSAKKDGRHYCCKACSQKEDVTPRRIHSRRKSRLKRVYGITLERYDEMFTLQDGRCAICREPPTDGQPLCVDHDHAAGAVRELLCHQCNLVLGHARDSVDILSRCVTYLTSHTAQKASA